MCSSPPTGSASTATRSASGRATPTRIPVGGGTGGARSLYSEGQAILATAATVIEKGKQAASEALEAAAADIVFEAGRFSIVGTDRGMDILELAAHQRRRRRRARTATMLDAAEVADIDVHTFPNGCHMAEVEVDPETGTSPSCATSSATTWARRSTR